VHVLARTSVSEAACSGCGVMSRRVHSSYQRQLADTASDGREVLIRLQARRFFCGNAACVSSRAITPGRGWYVTVTHRRSPAQLRPSYPAGHGDLQAGDRP